MRRQAAVAENIVLVKQVTTVAPVMVDVEVVKAVLVAVKDSELRMRLAK